MNKQVQVENVAAILEESRELLAHASVCRNGILHEEKTAAALSSLAGAGTSLADVERQHICTILERTGGIIAGPGGAAALLGIPRSTLQHRMRKLGIDPRTTQEI